MKFKITSTYPFFDQAGETKKQYILEINDVPIGIFDSEEEAEKFKEERFP